jgi:hypothetical protein
MSTEKKNLGGRKLFDGKSEEIVIQKLEEVWALDGTDAEAAFYAGISPASLSDYLKKHPDVSERKQALSQKPVLKARQAVVKNLDDPNHAFRYLEKKRRKEFGNGIDVTTGGQPVGGISPEVFAATAPERKAYDAKMAKLLRGE